MRLFRNRRRYSQRVGRRISPWLILLFCALGAILLTLLIGNLLKLWLDGEAYRQLTDGEETEEETEPPLYHAPLRNIRAQPFLLGGDTDDVWEFPDVSVSLNTPAGVLNYTSPVTQYFALPSNEKVAFGDAMGDLKAAASYISGIFYEQAFSEEHTELRHAATLRDAALMQEFLQAGGSEILVCGLPLEDVSFEQILTYLKAIKPSAQKAPLGVCVPVSFLQKKDAWESLQKLLQVCDFCALDLSGADTSKTDAEWLDFSRYYLVQYDMRLLLNETQTSLIEAADAMTNDLQIITDYPPAQEEPSEETTDAEE